MNRRGATAAITALAMVALIGCAGLAVDTARAWLVEDRLKTAIDAASLVAARQMSDPNRDAQATAVFWAQFTQGGGQSQLPGCNRHQSPDHPRCQRFLEDPGLCDCDRPDHAVRGHLGADGLVLGLRRGAACGHGTRGRARAGPDILDEHRVRRARRSLQRPSRRSRPCWASYTAHNDTQLNLWVSVVPFARTINVGTANSGFLNTTNMPPGWDVTKWTGCIEALRTGSDLSEAAPTGGSKFRPYFWPSTYKLVGTATGRCTNANAYPSSGGTRYCFGDNDWDAAGNGTPLQSDLNNNYMYNYLHTTSGMSQSQSVGPNILCALTPIQPLTASRTAVQNAVNAIQAPAKSGGTTTVVGLQGAWYTLSPSGRASGKTRTPEFRTHPHYRCPTAHPI